MAGKIIGIAGLLFLSSVKFIFAPGTIRIAGYGYWETIVISTLGGWMGVMFFYYVGRWFLDCCFTGWSKYISGKKREKRIFTKTNRFIVFVRKKFGIIGIAFITPPFISIPVGCLIASTYYADDRNAIRYLLLSVLFWSFLLSTLVHIYKYNIS